MLVQRIVYNVLDYLGDIGGLYGTFNGFSAVFSLILNFNGAYHLLTSQLFSVQTNIFKTKPKEQEQKPSDNNLRRPSQVNLFANKLAGQINSQAEKQSNIKEF